MGRILAALSAILARLNNMLRGGTTGKVIPFLLDPLYPFRRGRMVLDYLEILFFVRMKERKLPPLRGRAWDKIFATIGDDDLVFTGSFAFQSQFPEGWENYRRIRDIDLSFPNKPEAKAAAERFYEALGDQKNDFTVTEYHHFLKLMAADRSVRVDFDVCPATAIRQTTFGRFLDIRLMMLHKLINHFHPELMVRSIRQEDKTLNTYKNADGTPMRKFSLHKDIIDLLDYSRLRHPSRQARDYLRPMYARDYDITVSEGEWGREFVVERRPVGAVA
jgi:hypothetical protein